VQVPLLSEPHFPALHTSGELSKPCPCLPSLAQDMVQEAPAEEAADHTCCQSRTLCNSLLEQDKCLVLQTVTHDSPTLPMYQLVTEAVSSSSTAAPSLTATSAVASS